MDKIIFDRKLLMHNMQRYRNHRSNYDFLHQCSANKIYEDLSNLNRNYNNVLELQAFNDYLSKLLINSNNGLKYFKTNDDIICDEEFLPFKSNYFDLVISNLNLQFINNIQFYLAQIKSILKDNSTVIITFLGEDNLCELADVVYQSENEIYQAISPRIIPTIDLKTAGQLFQKTGFKNIIADLEKITFEFDEVSDILKTLKFMNFGNILVNKSRKFFTKKLLAKIIENYQKLYQNKDGKYLASFKIITVIAQK